MKCWDCGTVAVSPGRHTPHQSPGNGSVSAEQNHLQIYPRSMRSAHFQNSQIPCSPEKLYLLTLVLKRLWQRCTDKTTNCISFEPLTDEALTSYYILHPILLLQQFFCAMVASTEAQSNTGNGCKIYFAACLAVAQIERCCAVLGRDTSWAISQQICMRGCGGSGIQHSLTKVYNQSVGTIIVIPTRRAAGILRVIGCYNQLVTIKLMLNRLARQTAVDSSAVQYCLPGNIFCIIFAARHSLHIWDHCSSLHSVSVYNLLTLLRPAATVRILSQLSIIT